MPPAPRPDPSIVAEPSTRAPAEAAEGRWVVSPGIRYMAIGVFSFSVMALLVKLAGQRLPSQEIVLARAVITVALSWYMIRRAGLHPWGNDRPRLVIRGVLGFVGLFALYYSYIHLPLAEATVIQSTTPIFTAVIAAFWLRERFGLPDLVVAAISLLGVLLVARPAFLFGGVAAGLDPTAVAIALGGAVISGAAYVMVRRLRATEDPLVVVFYFAMIAVVVSAPLALPVALWPTPVEWVILLGVGVTTHFGQLFMTRGLHLETAGRATAVSYLQIVFATAFGAVFFAELPDLLALLGAALIVGGTLTLVLLRSRPAGRRLRS